MKIFSPFKHTKNDYLIIDMFVEPEIELKDLKLWVIYYGKPIF